MVFGQLDKQHFQTIEDFFGSAWLEEGCDQLQRDIDEAIARGVVDNRPEDRVHALHRSWYKLIRGRPLPTDVNLGRAAAIDLGLGQFHRLLTLEYLLKRLRPTWDVRIAQDVRTKLKNPPQFESTLYELDVLDHLRREGHPVQLVPSGPSKQADIRGSILGVPVVIECKRIPLTARPTLEQRQVLESLADEMLAILRNLPHPFVAILTVQQRPTESERRDILKHLAAAHSGLQYPTQRIAFGQRWEMAIIPNPGGDARLEIDRQIFDVIKATSTYRIPEGAVSNVRLVGIVDESPIDWSKNVRRMLKETQRQLRPRELNVVCLELADAPYFRHEKEVLAVYQGITQFLERDGNRVSGVIVSMSGIVPGDDPGTYRSAGSARLFRNPTPYIALPDAFEVPDFNYERVAVKADVRPTDSMTQP